MLAVLPNIISELGMRKDEVQILGLIEKVQKDQIYLLEVPKTVQQQFLHLFAHRHLLKQKMIHRNIDRSLSWLQGTFAQSSLRLAYATLCIQNQVQVEESLSPLITLINNWINYYPSTQRRTKVLLGELVLQDNESPDEFASYDIYLHYLNLISVDVWKLLTHSKEEETFYKERPLKEELSIWSKVDLKHVDVTDLLSFVSSCIPKVLLNIILEKASLPPEMREKTDKFECLYSNQNLEYYLRSSYKLSLLLKQIFLILLQLDLNAAEQKLMMQLAIRYYYVYHFNRRFTAPEILIYTFNKIGEDVRRALKDQFALFIKTVAKLGKQKFIDFLYKNSPFLRTVIEITRKKPIIGYSQESASPYNTINIAETITIERGSTVQRTFQVLQEYSIFYFRVVVISLDVTIKLYYLGDVASTKDTKMLLFTHQKKSGEIKTCINAMKKGLYQFEFDNTYSWINSKIIKYENIVYTPLQIKTVYTDEWIDDFYQNIYQNCMAKEEEIYLVKKRQQPKNQKLHTASLSKTDSGLSLFINKPNQQYQYETDNPERMEQKIVSVIKSKENYKWIAGKSSVEGLQDLQNFIRGIPLVSAVPEPEKIVQKIQKYRDEQLEEQLDEEEYEVVQRQQLDQSQIFSDQKDDEDRPKLSARGQKLSARGQKEGPAKEIKKTVEQNRSKDQLRCTTEETEQFYG